MKKYCAYCEKQHVSIQWNRRDDLYWCESGRQYMIRKYPVITHFGWSKLESSMNDRDSTGFGIVRMADRPDLRALYSLVSILKQHRVWNNIPALLYAAGLGIQLYSEYAITVLATELVKYQPAQLYVQDAPEWKVILRNVRYVLKDLTISEGQIMTNGIGRHVTQNPSERANGMVRFKQMLRSNKKWYDCCKSLAPFFGQPICMQCFFSVFIKHRIGGFTASTKYGNVRLCRSLIYACRGVFDDNDRSWKVFKSMSPHVRSMCKELGIKSTTNASEIRDLLRIETGYNEYSFADLMVFVCLI
jgi:hypothetical protein